jgi:hypothetical protein
MTDYKNLKVFQKAQINGLTKHLASLRFNEHEIAGRPNDAIIKRAAMLGLEIDYNDSDLLGEKFTFTKARRITKEQTIFGKAWLKNHFFKLNGQLRHGKNTENVNEQVLKIAKNVSRFEFIGVLGVANQQWEILSFLPVYRTYNAKGEYFDYAPIHWGQPIVMEE